MSKRVRLIPVVMVVVVLLALSAAAAASPLPVAAAPEVLAADGPAIEAPPPAADKVEHPWTARFLVPTVLLLGVVAVGGALFYYGVRIRGKYRIQ